MTSTPPIAATRTSTREIHGRSRHDDYEWLRAKEDPEVLAHLEAENAWTEERTAHLGGLREQVFEEIRTRTRETDLSVPTRVGDWWYYHRSFQGREYGATCRVAVAAPDDWTAPVPDSETDPGRPALPGEELLLDLDALAEGHEFFSLGGNAVSLDGTLLAYSLDVVGDERYEVRVLDLATRALREDHLTGVVGGATWSPDGESFYYVTVDDAWRSDTVWQHRLGTPQSDDEIVRHEPDERFGVGVGRSRSQRFLITASHSKTTTEYAVLDTEQPDLGFRTFSARREGLEYSIEHAVVAGEDRFVVTHNADGPNFGVSLAPVAPTPPEQWEALLPHDAAVRVEDVDAFAGHLLVHQRSGGLTQLRVLDLGPEGVTDDYLVPFGRDVYTVGAMGNRVFASPVVRLGLTSLTLPSSVYDYDVRTRTLTLLRQQDVLGDFDGDDYEEHRLWASAPDGEPVPISLVVRRDARASGPVPLHLYGYGSYEHSIDPGFSIARLSLLDRGGAFAVAHVRGGGEMGRRWYDDGKLLRKQNTFGDFIACARHLRETGWASRVVAEGASAGGLLVGAVVNQAPEAFDGAVAGVPFVDALTTMLDSSLPLTVSEYDEWGNPEGDPEVYDYMSLYAPYDNVGEQDYPPILAETSLNDTRVFYVEPAKWVARLRATAEDHRPDVLLRTEMAGGHGGVSGRYKSWRERAFTLAWILDRLGLADR